MAKPTGFLTEDYATSDKLEKVKKLNEIAINQERNLAQMAIVWLLKDDRATTVLVGTRKV